MTVPFALLPYQRAWCQDPSPVKVIEKSRRIGLSWCEAADCALLAASSKGMDTWYVGYNRDMAQEFIRDGADWSRHYQLAASAMEEIVIEDEGRDIQAFRIHYPSGFRVTALSSRPSNLRGKQGRIVLDEAAFHDNLSALLKAALAMLMWGGQVHVLSTHNGVDNPFNALVTDVRAKRKPYSIHRVTLDDALAAGLYKRICLVQGRPWSPDAEEAWRRELIEFYGDDAQEELFCVPRHSEGSWLPGHLIEARMQDLPVLRWSAPENFLAVSEAERQAAVDDWLQGDVAPLLAALDPKRTSGFGWDFGRTGDLSVFAPWQIQQDMTRRFPFLVELRNMPFRQQERALFYMADRLPQFVAGAVDARGNGQYIAEVAALRYGARIREVWLSPSWYAENTAPFKAAFEDGTIIVPRDADVHKDLRAFKVVNGVPRLPDARQADERGLKRHGDAGMALLLGYWASRQDGPELFGYEPVTVRRGEDGDRAERAVRVTAGFKAHGGLFG
ncbi:MAG: terminase large subunit domain-containing protein [Acidobacteriota bacterium]